MKKQILKLRKQGKSYRQIEKILGCSRSLIAYYLSPTTKKRHVEQQNKNRYKRREIYKMKAGGKCQKCGYNKCLNALQFHHNNPSEKKFSISAAIWKIKRASEKEIEQEINKCTLLCANCHFELHAHITCSRWSISKIKT